MHLQANQARRRLGRLTGMHPHPHPDMLPSRPRVRLQSPLQFQHRRHARPRRGEHREERIALGIDLPAVMSGKTRPDQPVMVGKQLCVEIFSQPLNQGRRALDVGKHEREGLHRHSLKANGPPGTTPGHAAILRGR
jgi:hypothetical protein